MAVLETTARANAALDELYRQHVGDVYRYTYAVLGNHADAEDVTQTTFVNALRALERGETPEDPSRWLIVIAHNLVRQRWRQAAARPALVELETDVPDSSNDDDDAVELEELVRALQRIPETQREALVMRELEGRSYREIAIVLGLSTSALETLLFRARRSLADELENVVTCQNAEVAISKRLDSRLSRKERRRLDEHLADCPDCARLAKTEARQRKAFKGLALLPLPIGLALFKGAPSAAAATSLPTIGLASSGTGTTATATGTAGAGTATGGAVAGSSLVGGIAFKVAAIAATIAVASGVGYKGVQTLQNPPSTPLTAVPKNAPGSAAKPKPVVVTTHPKTRHKASRPATHPSRRVGSVTGSRRDGVTPAASTSESHSAATENSPSQTSSAPAHSAASPPVATHPAASKPATTSETAGPTGGSQRSVKTPAPKAPAPNAPAPSKSNSGTASPAPTPAPKTGDASSGTGTSAPSGATPPSTSTPAAGASSDSTPGGPATDTPPASSPPSSTPSTPPSTPAVTTPPVTTPSSTPPNGDPSGGSSSDSTGDTSGSSDGAGSASEHRSSHAANPMERGLKLGLHKDENEDGHPSHP